MPIPGFIVDREVSFKVTTKPRYESTRGLFGEGKVVSDGTESPNGRLIAYPVMARFVRKVHFKYDQAQVHFEQMSSSINVGGSVGYGPFCVGGSYSHGEQDSKFGASTQGSEIIMEGIQLIGFVNNLIPTSPDPDPAIKPEE